MLGMLPSSRHCPSCTRNVCLLLPSRRTGCSGSAGALINFEARASARTIAPHLALAADDRIMGSTHLFPFLEIRSTIVRVLPECSSRPRAQRERGHPKGAL